MHPSRMTAVSVPVFAFACAVLLAACAQTDDNAATVEADTAGDAAATASLTSIADVGFQTPESVLYDEQADVYIVSNINGEPLGADGNGFISRVRPTGAVESLKWIDGEADGITLNAPKGMALSGDTLFVADIDSVRAFHRTTGEPLGARGIAGASFLNDLTTGPDGALYVTDTGMDASFSPTGTDAIHRFDATGSQSFAGAPDLAAPNGIVADDGGIIVVGFGGPVVQRIAAGGGTPDSVATLPAGQLDGVVRTSDGTLFVSSWEGQAVYRVSPDGAVSTVVENVEAPADIGWDTRRQRLLIPLFNGNRIEVREIR
ncbi:MAG TPA: SMP-30/gluconolactonase/LRE family protein [Longimicrobiales bacterium]|nr:SMP-30/gluconolactonase/LRE family protein [Longimicrobiales bacterium]